jgi:hypothetical protein
VPLCPADRTIIVATENHRADVGTWLPERRHGRVVFQSEDRGTAAAVLFGLVPILAADPTAVVVVTLADHGDQDSESLRADILDAVVHVERHGDVVACGRTVVVAPALKLFDLCRERLPGLTAPFVGALTMPPLTRDAFLAHHYARLTPADFSRDVVT